MAAEPSRSQLAASRQAGQSPLRPISNQPALRPRDPGADFIALGAVLAMLAAGASAKTLKVTKAEVVQHRAVDVVQHRVPPAEPVDPAILRAHRQRFRDEMPLP